MKKKKINNSVKIEINYRQYDKQLGYKGYKYSQLKTYLNTLSKSARIYGDTRLANKLNKWANIKLKEHVKNQEGVKIRRMVNIVSNLNKTAITQYGKNEIGNTLILEAVKPPRDSQKLKQFREKRKEITMLMKAGKKLSPELNIWVLENAQSLSEVMSKEEKEYTSIVLNIIDKSGGFNNAYSKYQADVDRLISSGGLDVNDILLLSSLQGNDQTTNIPNKLKYKK